MRPGVKSKREASLVPFVGSAEALPSLAPRSRGRPGDPAVAYLASLTSEESRRTQANALRSVARLFRRPLEGFPWHSLRAVHTRALRALLAGTVAPATANRYLSAVREVLKCARRLGQLGPEALEQALDFKRVKGSREPPGRWVPLAEIQTMFDSAKADKRRRRGARDAAIVALLFGLGLRRFEVAGLDRPAFNGRAVRVLGKGNKEREIPLPDGARRALEDWLAVRGDHAGPLIEDLDLPGTRLSPNAIATALKRLLARAGVSKASTHDGRRSVITYLLDEAGVSLGVVQELAGHSNPAQTAKYRRGHVRAKEKAVALLPVPY